jgi:N6-L-threonylcarbamoyladenine synthase
MIKMTKKRKLVLGIESSCDETGLAIVAKKKGELPQVLINLIFSQEQLHSRTQGIVPEIAAREQVAKIFPMLKKLNDQLPLKEIDSIGVSYGPGLVGSLLVGVNLAKSLA